MSFIQSTGMALFTLVHVVGWLLLLMGLHEAHHALCSVGGVVILFSELVGLVWLRVALELLGAEMQQIQETTGRRGLKNGV